MLLTDMSIRVVRRAEAPHNLYLDIKVRTAKEEFSLREVYPYDDFKTVFDLVWDRAKEQFDHEIAQHDTEADCK